jgi:hypothetical protein
MKKKKKEILENIEKFDFMKTNKDNITNILWNEENLPKINELVYRTNQIVIHTYLFLKLYIIELYYQKKDFPKIDKEYLCDIFKVITIRECNSGGYTNDTMPEKLKTLKKFYNDKYKNLIVKDDVIYYDGLSYVLAYEAIDMITNINNNIEMHLIDHINKYINLHFEIKKKAELITKENNDKNIRKEKHKELYAEFRKVKNDLLSFNDMTSDVKYHDWIKEERKRLFPKKTKFEKDNIQYDIAKNTQDYLYTMFYVAEKMEEMNKVIIEENAINDTKNKQIRLFNVLPLRSNIVPKNICIDTPALISNFCETKIAETLKNYKENNMYDKLWSKLFRLRKRVFKKKNYKFNYMIRTDGVSCCILFIRTDKSGVPLKKTQKNKSNKQEDDTKYIEKVTITEEMKKKKVVCIDPGMSDLIYCGSKNENKKKKNNKKERKDNNLDTFRYTQNQRRLETRNKKYNKITDKINKETKINNEKTVKETETELSKLNKKTINQNNFIEYTKKKNETNNKLKKHYQQKIFRKFNLNRFTNTQKSENKMLKNFENKFGSKENVLVVMGDYDKGSNNMRGKEPTICKKFRCLFKNKGYETYLINEFRTSIKCNECSEELEKFKMNSSKKPYNKGELCLCNGLLRCQSVKHKSEIFHNRDKNAVQNMLNIVKSIFETGKRPEIFSREETTS